MRKNNLVMGMQLEESTPTKENQSTEWDAEEERNEMRSQKPHKYGHTVHSTGRLQILPLFIQIYSFKN